jgi:ribosomal-protein-alanine N-acetyltransferase
MFDDSPAALNMLNRNTSNDRRTPGGIMLQMCPLKSEQIPAVMELERSSHTHPWRLSSFEDCLSGRQQCWLAYLDKTLVGYVVFAHGGGDAELLNIVVAKDFQRRGIGGCLIQYAIECMKTHADMLFLEVRLSNRKAIELYAKEGFFEVGQRRNGLSALGDVLCGALLQFSL